ncbi:hypothetical protein BEWA_006530 [Theileria equi strain WA]|uniref:PWI domain-containing protein n=1 Tax=Theileria equi strain WA TaxID=1537102 RepID=L0B290_THEEQ|nr:hypothetical protein BEWA_006530 [Theileria equi strain WA]AFZ81244.1 hypothetical protein BEWA_006530 [Theileria equi strain WA]|eukprot:XP_004830910.1 hypothetical protein BEWA_006530 [Theileria equi strain WA]
MIAKDGISQPAPPPKPLIPQAVQNAIQSVQSGLQASGVQPGLIQPGIMVQSPPIPQSRIPTMAPVLSAIHSQTAAVITKAPTNMPSIAPYPPQLIKPLIDTLMGPAVPTIPLQSDDTVKLTNVVYVGGLTSDTSNEFIIKMLQKCGKISHFKRHTDPSSGLLATFAFCDFESPGGAYYAMECLSDIPYKEGRIKISCNEKVKDQIATWKEQKIAEIKSQNPEYTTEKVAEHMKSTQDALREEFNGIIKLNDTTVEEIKPITGQPVKKKVETPRETVNEVVSYTTKEYTVHHKESHRRNKIRSKKRDYDERFRDDEPEWIREEEKLLRRLNRLGTVKQSLREKLIKEDLEGLSRYNPRIRQKERIQDEEDAQEEESEARKKHIPIHAQPAPVVEQKKSIPNVFAAQEEEEETIYTKKHKPLVKLRKDEDIWEQVPTEEEQVFKFPLDWDGIFKDGTVNALIEPWIRKCIQEYMGDEESLVNDVIEFLTGRLAEHPTPSELLFDVEQFLDDESKGFVLQLWRMLIFQHMKLEL